MLRHHLKTYLENSVFSFNSVFFQVRMFSGHTLYDVDEALAKNKGGRLRTWSNTEAKCIDVHRSALGKPPTTNNAVGNLVKVRKITMHA